MGHILTPFRAWPVGPTNTHRYFGWTLTTSAAYYPRDGARLEFFNGKYWLMGGWNPANNPEWGTDVTTNSVWSSPDLITWTLELAHDPNPPTSGAGARWRRRHTFMSFVKDGYLWVMGGDQEDGFPVPSDVWRSADGTTWERMAASSPWGPNYLPIGGLYNNEFHVLGGFPAANSGNSVASHWKSSDGVNWTQLPDMPFDRGSVTKAIVHDGFLFVIGGSRGGAQSPDRTFPNDTWAWNGTRWRQMSRQAVWTGRDWIGTASFDGKLWVFTGATGINNGGAWYSEDLGVTWTHMTSGIPWEASHADAFTVTSDGLVIASGNNHGTNVYALQALPADPSTAMQLQSWTSRWDASKYNFGLETSPQVLGLSSAGSSAAKSYGVPELASIGKVDGRPSIVLDGATQFLRYTDGGESADLFNDTEWTVFYFGRLPTPTTNNTRPFDNADLGGNGTAFMSIALKSSGPTIAAYQDGGGAVEADVTFTANTLICVQARYDGTQIQVRLNKGAWTSATVGNAPMTGSYHVGVNYNGSVYAALEILDYATADYAVSDADLDACVDDMALKYPSFTP